MKVIRTDLQVNELSDPVFPGWASAPAQEFPLVPTPLKGNPGIKAISPFIEKSTDHGSVTSLVVAAAHNGENLAIHLSWSSGKNDQIVDLDEFVDGVAVMFPLTPNASAITMGSKSDPVNAWYWKGNLRNTAFDVVATGYGTSGRHNDSAHPIVCRARHANGRWQVVLTRALQGAAGRIVFAPGDETRMAFAVWDGGNRERSGRKSFSGDFMPVKVEA
ncbi:MAG: ethylbenzene dehydrogenase-related protein [Gammaproteobacteria bacterium]